MATKAGEVLKVLMGMGVMVTLNDVIDQDTALLVVEEIGHTGVVSKEETIEDKLIEKSKAVTAYARLHRMCYASVLVFSIYHHYLHHPFF
jgi:hypothetical protein